MNLTPLHDRLIVRAAAPEEVTKGGIILPDTAKEKPQQGEVLAVGTGKVDDNGKAIPMAVKVGDTVLYGKYSGTEIAVDGEDLLIMRESDVFAVVSSNGKKK
ncbi:MAG TPA: co-chaperone GroES [Candidatus Kapabacteria bacterium]|nr:co-chaperone GroES [Candidatus Kapabacteria bacterium]